MRKILADTEEVGLGVIPEKFIRQIYLKSLPPQWNSFKLKQSGHDGKVVDLSSGTRVMRERNMEELMEAASEHKAMGHLPDDDEHPHQKAFLTGEKNKYPSPQKIGSTTTHQDLVCSNPKCGMRGHTIRFCTKEGGGLAKASSEWKKEYFRLVREYGRRRHYSGLV